MKRAFNQLASDRRGSTVVEAALVMPVILVMLCSVADMVQLTFLRFNLQQYANSGAELAGMSGATIPTNTEISNQIAADNGLAASAVTVSRWTECNASPKTTIGECANATDQRADYLKVSVQGRYNPLMLNPSLGGWVPATSYTAYSTARIK